MKFKIPFTFSSTEILRKKSKFFLLIRAKRHSKLSENLKNADAGLSREEYISICLKSFLIFFVVFSTISSSVLYLLQIKSFYLYGLLIAFVFSGFMFFIQLGYPRIYSLRKTRDIEKNLIPVMQDMLVQLSSGVPIFNILVNLANEDYGSVSREFGKAVKEINSGKPQIEAIEELGNRNTSVYFRRILWQISNGMRSGSDMSIVIKEGVNSLSKEQAIQIQSYGSKLNPLIMFYMLIAVILPALGITFLTIISSMLGWAGDMVKLMFLAIFAFVVFIQIMFLGVIKSRRPSLL